MKSLITLVSLAVFFLTALPSRAQKVAYVNMEEIISSMPDAARVDTAINRYQLELYQQYQSMQQQLQTESEAFIKDSLTMSDVAREVKRNSLQDTNLRMLQFRQGINQKVSQKYGELMKPVIDKARAAVAAVAKVKGYGYVINNTPGGGLPLLPAKPGQDDLTGAVNGELGVR